MHSFVICAAATPVAMQVLIMRNVPMVYPSEDKQRPAATTFRSAGEIRAFIGTALVPGSAVKKLAAIRFPLL